MTGEDYEARKDEHRPDWPGYKTDHLPECDEYAKAHMDACVCRALRACESRLASKVWEASGVSTYRYGYTAGLSAARDAVAAVIAKRLDHYDNDAWISAVTVFMATDEAFAAIDALRGSGNPDTPPSAEKGEQA